jgi:drug/metabolite transporter (DMT)-like permease
MSSKVVMVAFVLAFHLHLPPKWQTWLAAVLVVGGVACMQSGGSAAKTATTEGARPPSIFAAVFFALLAALSYAVYDVMTQVYSSQMEFHRVVPFGMFVCFALSLLLLPFAARGTLAARPPRMLLLSVILLTLQSLILITTIGKFGDAANCNIVYSSRGIFSVLFAWLLGSWFNVSEVSQPGVALRRLGGAAIILVAIALVLV